MNGANPYAKTFKNPSPRSRKLVLLVKAYVRDVRARHGRIPTIDEIKAKFGLSHRIAKRYVENPEHEDEEQNVYLENRNFYHRAEKLLSFKSERETVYHTLASCAWSDVEKDTALILAKLAVLFDDSESGKKITAPRLCDGLDAIDIAKRNGFKEMETYLLGQTEHERRGTDRRFNNLQRLTELFFHCPLDESIYGFAVRTYPVGENKIAYRFVHIQDGTIIKMRPMFAYLAQLIDNDPTNQHNEPPHEQAGFLARWFTSLRCVVRDRLDPMVVAEIKPSLRCYLFPPPNTATTTFSSSLAVGEVRIHALVQSRLLAWDR